MPSLFIRECAQALHDTGDYESVLNRIRERCTVMGVPTQIARIREHWMIFDKRHPDYERFVRKAIKKIQKHEKHEDMNQASIALFEHFCHDPLVLQCKKQRDIKFRGGYSGDEYIDHLIVEIPLFPEYMKNFHVSKDDQEAVRHEVKESLEARSAASITITNAKEILGRAAAILRDKDADPFMIFAAVGLVTGRRNVEIIKTGNFEKCARGKYSALFSGAAKKRLNEADTPETYEIPLLAKFKIVCKALGRARAALPRAASMENAAINQSFGKRMGTAAQRLLRDDLVTAHSLRKCYGALSFQSFKNTMSFNLWLCRVLLHDGLDVSVHYSNCKIEGDVDVLGSWA